MGGSPEKTKKSRVRNSKKKKKKLPALQSARFREAAREAGGDQKSFEIAFKEDCPTKAAF